MDTNPTRFEALQAAVTKAGGQSQFARQVGTTQPTVWRWLNQSRQLPAEFVLIAERLFGVSRHDLRPDIYPRPAIDPEAIEDTLANPLADRFYGIDLGTPDRIAAGARR
jgi:DNA-binding transcriptional regulator YdaS (Cro superfamily)